MHLVFFNGGNIATKEQTEHIEFAINIFLSQWNIHNEFATIFIELQSEELPSDCIAASRMEDDLNYEIIINKFAKITLQELFISLAHEIVHIKQYYKKELVNKIIFNERFTTWHGKDISHLSYEEYPHEKEAYKYQELMIADFFKQLSLIHSTSI